MPTVQFIVCAHQNKAKVQYSLSVILMDPQGAVLRALKLEYLEGVCIWLQEMN